MAYFNGEIHGWNDIQGYHPPASTTKRFCDACAETAIPLPPRTGVLDGSRHHGTGFKWAPWYGGDTHCDRCRGPVDRKAATSSPTTA